MFLRCSVFFAMMVMTSIDGHASASDESLRKLLDGNQRYVTDRLQFPDRSSDRRLSLIANQKPFAVILGCSDSRVPPEIIFDQGLGDLFVVRVAGNVVSPVVLDSIEYACKYLGSSVIMILGHENCGAVQAVYDGKTEDIEAIADKIFPAIKKCKKEKRGVTSCIKENVRNVEMQLKDYSPIRSLIGAGDVKVVGAFYSLATGKVEVIPETIP